MGHWRALSIILAVACAAFTALMLFAQPTHHAAANPIGGLTSISAGEGTTCAVTTVGGVKCWGQTGEPAALAQSDMPVDVTGFAAPVVDVSTGYFSGCALMDNGGVMCFGDNHFGALGDGTTESSAQPQSVVGLSTDVTQISAGDEFACAVMATGGVECWGYNDYGQLGQGTTGYSAIPGAVIDISDAVSVSAGGQHACAVTSSSQVLCWGRNGNGQLGDGTEISRLTAVPVPGLSGVSSLAGSLSYTCAVMNTGRVECWGLGYGLSPVDVPGIDDAVAIDAGYTHMCVLTSAGDLKCWGSNGRGELGDGRDCGPSKCPTPSNVKGLSGAIAISSGAFDSCAVRVDGSAACWGNNGYGQLGIGDSNWDSFRTTPVDLVEQTIKPTSTPTPCPGESCPPPTPTPAVPRTGLDFSISIDANGDNIPDCSTAAGYPTECSVEPGSTFYVIASVDALPQNMTGYDGFDIALSYAGIRGNQTWNSLWPDCGFPAQSFDHPSSSQVGCAGNIGAQESTSIGPLAALQFTCAGNGSVTLVQGLGISDLVDSAFMSYGEHHPDETLAVTCGSLERGDTNCDTAINTIDVVVTLQYDAGLVERVGCPQQSDVNLDSQTNAIDAGLTLQYDATLIDSLPPNQRPR